MLSPKKFAAFFVMAGLMVYSSFAYGETQTSAAPLSQEYQSYSAENSHEGGYVPSPIDRSHLKSNPPVFDTKGNVGANYDKAYDLRNVNSKSYLPAVRNQGSYGTCWAHAAIGAVESNYLRKGLTFLSAVDLSELHMAWFVYKDVEGKAFSIKSGSFSGGEVFGQGGNADKSIAYMSRLAGPVLETELPYTSINSDVDAFTTSLNGKTTPEQYNLAIRLHDAYTLGDMTESLRPVVKEFIRNSGAVQVSYYSGQTVATTSSGTDVSAYYQKDSNTYTYYDNSGNTPNHAVLLVGWDDDFSADNFNPKPSGNGAWLVRNSWGDTWGTGGYFWMSYEQKITGVTAYAADEAKSGLNVYYHDALGRTGSVSFAWAANVFQAGNTKDESISGVGFYTTDNNAAYDLYIFDLGESTPSSPVPENTSNPLYKSENTKVACSGYHVVDIPKNISIGKGHYFSVIMKMSTPKYGFPTAVEQAVSDYASPAINAGESYFASGSTLPATWTDGYNGVTFTGDSAPTPMNACIKAFTVTTPDSSSGITIASTFTDDKLKEYVATFDTDSNGTLSDTEISAVTSLNLKGLGITSTTGLANLTNITALDISGNPGVKTLDISPFTSLTLDNITADPSLTITNGAGNTASFAGHSLILSGQIGVNFYVTLPEDFSDENAYMVFTVNNTPGKAITLEAAELDDTDGAYIFTCPINSIQMAEDITATFHYGDGLEVSNKCSASDYIDLVKADTTLAESNALLKLVNAIKDYGSYVQTPLAKANGWTIGTDYAKMTAATTYDSTTVTNATTAVAGFALTGADSSFTVGMDLELNSETTLHLYITKADGTSEIAVTPDANDGDMSSEYDSTSGKYTVTVSGISAHKLGNVHTVLVTAGGTTYNVKASALSYVHNVLSDTQSAEEKSEGITNAVTSIYNYYKATMDYRSSDY
ncbi:MAG: hypothetical protein IJR63_03330 [Synergistaceae bacterium]|nr:hypothetical protein [Synergistaceae bacterium]